MIHVRHDGLVAFRLKKQLLTVLDEPPQLDLLLEHLVHEAFAIAGLALVLDQKSVAFAGVALLLGPKKWVFLDTLAFARVT